MKWSALHKHEKSNKKGRETEKKTANVQMPRTVGVVRPVTPILHIDDFLYKTSRLYVASHCLQLVEILTEKFPRGEILTFPYSMSSTSCDAI